MMCRASTVAALTTMSNVAWSSRYVKPCHSRQRLRQAVADAGAGG